MTKEVVSGAAPLYGPFLNPHTWYRSWATNGRATSIGAHGGKSSLPGEATRTSLTTRQEMHSSAMTLARSQASTGNSTVRPN